MSERDDLLGDLDAERALIGACLISDIAIEDSALIVTPSDFRHPQHQLIYAAILDEARKGRVDTVTVAAAVNEDGVASYLHELQNATPAISNAGRYAHTIADMALRRHLVYASADIVKLAHESTDAGEAAEAARALLQPLDLPIGQGAPDPDVDTFIASTDMEYDWLIPGWLEHRDRMLLTSSEGAGKSVFLAQIAMMLASGIHPWTHEPIPPRNALIIDLENSPRLVTRRLNKMRATAGSKLDPQRLRVHTRPAGIDLTTRADRRWLIDRCQANSTSLLCIGPVYRMYAGSAAKGDTGAEDQIRSLTAALDEIRMRCGVTLILETHAPHGRDGMGRDLRPFGSSVWMRWPEFGIGLRRMDPENFDRWSVEHWRGPRDERNWPEELHRNSGNWPWTPRMPTRMKAV